MNELKYDKININKSSTITLLNKKLIKCLSKKRHYHKLFCKDNGTFSLKKDITTNAGWYIILDKGCPIYVGTAKNLNNRLNSDTGSLDNFSYSSRTSDSKRNFLKKFSKIGVIKNLNVCIIKESDLGYRQLSKIDRENIEKYIEISRGELEFRENKKGRVK